MLLMILLFGAGIFAGIIELLGGFNKIINQLLEDISAI